MFRKQGAAGGQGRYQPELRLLPKRQGPLGAEKERGQGERRNNKKQCLLCFMSMLLSLGSRKDFKQINSPLGWQTALAANFRP